MLRVLVSALQVLAWPLRRLKQEFEWRRRYRIVHVEDLPDQLKLRTLYVVGEPGFPLHASMACPHKTCSAVLNMNLAPDERPMWTLVQDAEGAPTLRPSVWRRTTCGCHFFLRRGRIDWC